jgi:hypothetical protein
VLLHLNFGQFLDVILVVERRKLLGRDDSAVVAVYLGEQGFELVTAQASLVYVAQVQIEVPLD